MAALGLASLFTASTATADVQPNIVGGSEATGNTSWMASLQYDAPAYGIAAHHTCGAALLFRSWVVTNAHCVTDVPGDTQHIPTSAKTFSVRVGSKDRTTGGETAKVVRVVVHPGWQWAAGAPENPVDDVAMLQLDHAVNMQPIQLAGHAAKPGDRVTLYGWGADQPDGGDPLPLKLQQLSTKVLAPVKCADAQQSVGEICTSNPHGTDGPGGGDSGGPAVSFAHGVPQLVGTCSRGAAQYPGEAPTVYTSSPEFREWLYGTARGGGASAA
ncbi:trypsin-like serine protease [Amycolatopsis sp. NBC_01488]|uniref:S1 family peptidase n=1 Tax=Amycolatopsis sp. NBC_01488 TaxID=2903563 RepID=UPI002E2B04A8|nr:trypsin-like serine protease [Amycolatopsis sp. NBC_01488]